jgi:hypothetical protein
MMLYKQVTIEQKDQLVEIKCPFCGNSGLEFKVENSVEVASKNFEFYQRQLDLEDEGQRAGPEDYDGKACGFLICNNYRCKERVIFHAKTFAETHIEYDDENLGFIAYHTELQFDYYNPSPFLFDLPKKFPASFKDQIQKVFNAYWTDGNSFLNNMRILLEMIMDHKRVKKHGLDKNGKKIQISLHNRIKDHWKTDQRIKEMAIALKWLGNDGSHGETLKSETMNISLDLLEYIINKLYKDDAEEKLLSKARKINKKR